MSGIAYHTPLGGVDDPLNQPPLKPGGRQSEYIAGSTAATATMFAVLHRSAGGLGQHVDVSQQESMAVFLRHQVAYYTYDPEGEYPTSYGSRERGKLRGFGYLPCKDGYVVNGSREAHQWRALLEMAAADEWEADKELRDILDGEWDLFLFVEKMVNIRPVILEWMATRTKQEIAEMAQARRIPIAPCNSAEDMFNSPHLTERESLIEIVHPETGPLTFPRAPFRFSETPSRIDRPAPRLGEHNDEILGGRLGYSGQDMAELREAGVI
jgi:crotonobetainyl-CoA:carnitine CoA-transferase CaiB-like acyl-CoA transferase